MDGTEKMNFSLGQKPGGKRRAQCNGYEENEDNSDLQTQAHILKNFDEFLCEFKKWENFAYCKINHAFWEKLALVHNQLGEKLSDDELVIADRIYDRKLFFSSGFAFELLNEIEKISPLTDQGLFVGLSLSAWPGDQKHTGTPQNPEISVPFLEKFQNKLVNVSNGLILKESVINGRIGELFDELKNHNVLVVGPNYIRHIVEIIKSKSVEFMEIPQKESWLQKCHIEEQISNWIGKHESAPTTVLLQAGAVAPYLVLRLRQRFLKTRFIDGGLAFSIAAPDDLFKRPWGQVFRKEIAQTHNALFPDAKVAESAKLEFVDKIRQRVDEKFPELSLVESCGKVSFVEDKSIDLKRVSHFLKSSKKYNRWSNRGPAWFALAAAYEMFFEKLSNKDVIPCSSGAIALQAMANLKSIKVGKRLRWCVSSFGFANTGRPPFDNSIVVDCDENGLLSLAALSEFADTEYDGIIVTNPFGQAKDFSEFVKWASFKNKEILIDNAAGISNDIPNLPYQCFSLHHTKPFGFGEGGLAVLPSEDRELFLKLIEYSPSSEIERQFWISNGKLSDLACASHLARLESAPNWLPLYDMQVKRILSIANKLQFRPLIHVNTAATSIPLLAPIPVSSSTLSNHMLTLAKYYKPLAATPNCSKIFDHVVNVPSHPDVARLEKTQIEEILSDILTKNNAG